jgi:hypothetical protein
LKVVRSVEVRLQFFRPGVLHGGAQHPSIAGRIVVEQIAEHGEAQPVCIPLDLAHGLEVTARVLEAKIAARRAFGRGTDLDPREVRRARGPRAVLLVGARVGATAACARPDEHAVEAVVEVKRARRAHAGAVAGRQRREPVQVARDGLVWKVAAAIEVLLQHRALQHGAIGFVRHAVAARQREPQPVDGGSCHPVQQIAAPLMGACNLATGEPRRGSQPLEVAVGRGIAVAGHRVPVAPVDLLPVEAAAVGGTGVRELQREIEHHVRIDARCHGRQRFARQFDNRRGECFRCECAGIDAVHQRNNDRRPDATTFKKRTHSGFRFGKKEGKS